MDNVLIGRRLLIINNTLTTPEKRGDYCGPITGYSGDKPAVFFIPPNPQDIALHHVTSPPHVFTEEPNGTLTIRDSIGAHGLNGMIDGWHGFLTKGVWEKVKEPR